MKNNIDTELLERMEQAAQDTKKEIGYNKPYQCWFWREWNAETVHAGFRTRLDALIDAVEPYINPED